MKYPILIHKESGIDYGVTIPDIPGCFSVGRNLVEALNNLQEAVECYYEGEEITAPPEASRIVDLMRREDIFIKEGSWGLFDLDFSFLFKRRLA